MIRNTPCDGVYLGDGEWISWSDFGEVEPDTEYETYLARLEGESDLAHKFPCAEPTVLRQFLRLGNAAQEHFEMTGRHLNIYVQLGELFAAVRYGISLHVKPDAPGSDGRLGKAFMEIKTISPRSTTDRVRVSMAGHWSHLVVIKITPEFDFAGHVVPRKSLRPAGGGFRHVSWSRAADLAVATPSS